MSSEGVRTIWRVLHGGRTQAVAGAVKIGDGGHVEPIGAYQARTSVSRSSPIDRRPASPDRGDCHSWARRVGVSPKRCVNAAFQAHDSHHEYRRVFRGNVDVPRCGA